MIIQIMYLRLEILREVLEFFHTKHFPHSELAHEQVWMSEEGELGIKYIEAVNCIVIVGFMRKTCSF